jgi:hypothetical protein
LDDGLMLLSDELHGSNLKPGKVIYKGELTW